MSHPDVAEAAAIAMPHPKWQERPMLIIVAQQGKNPNAEAIRGTPEITHRKLVDA